MTLRFSGQGYGKKAKARRDFHTQVILNEVHADEHGECHVTMEGCQYYIMWPPVEYRRNVSR